MPACAHAKHIHFGFCISRLQPALSPEGGVTYWIKNLKKAPVLTQIAPFENGRIVKEKAGKNQEFLTALLNTDAGARYLGEWGIGTNYGITRFTKNMLFDEKIGGTIHLAAGMGMPEAGGKNESGLHWDMLCDMSSSEVLVDGDLFYKDGKPVI